jgi:GxxExxY protein
LILTFDTIMDINKLSSKIIGAAIEVHKTLGPGLLESTYEECLCCELSLRGINFKRQEPLFVEYKGIHLDCSYRLDVVVEDLIIVELKAIVEIEPIHKAQLLTYLKLSGLQLGLLLNFNVLLMREGIVRVVYNLSDGTAEKGDNVCFSTSQRKATEK